MLNKPGVLEEINRLHAEEGMGDALFTYVSNQIAEGLEAIAAKNMNVYAEKGLLDVALTAKKNSIKIFDGLKFNGKTIDTSNIKDAIRE